MFTNAPLAPTPSDELAAKGTKQVGERRARHVFIASQATLDRPVLWPAYRPDWEPSTWLGIHA